MLHSLNDLLGFRIVAGDPIGVVTDLLFDGHSSQIRYLRVESESWLPGGDILIAPQAIERVEPQAQILRTDLAREAVKRRPSLGEPGSPEPTEEARLHGHFGWTPYWSEASGAGGAPYWPAATDETGQPSPDEESARRADHPPGEPGRRLRSAWDVLGFALNGPDGEIGAVEDLILDLDPWMIRYLVVSTGVWLPGKQVLISPQWLSRIDWSARSVTVELPRADIEAAPTYDRNAVLDRGLEEALHRAVGKPTYW